MTGGLLYVIGELHTGGSERQLCYLLQAMDRPRYRPAVAVWNYSAYDVHLPKIQALGVPVHPLPRGVSRLVKVAALRRLVGQLRPAVVHSWSFYTNFAAHLATRGRRAISIGSLRSGFSWAVQECGPLVGRLSARWPQTQVCNSAAAAASVRATRTCFAPPRLCIVPNGIDLQQFPAEPVRVEEPVRIVGVGYLLPVKRWDRLLRAIEELKRRGVNCRLELAGDGPLRPALEKLAAELHVADRVEFLGHVGDIAALLARASFVVHTGDSEGCPNAVMEAMACGRAVVATDAGDIPWLVDDGQTGYIVGRDDYEALVERIACLISDVHRCKSMGEAARARAEQRFALQRLVNDTFEVYRSCGWDRS